MTLVHRIFLSLFLIGDTVGSVTDFMVAGRTQFSRRDCVSIVRCISGLKYRTVYWKSMICTLLPNAFLCVTYKLLESVPSEG